MFDFNNKKVSVTGGAGMIGREVIDLLVKSNAEVTCIDIIQPSNLTEDVNFNKADLRFFDQCMNAFQDCDYVIACAGIKGSPEACANFPAKFFVPMVQFNTNCMEAARLCGVEGYVYVSSIGVYSPAEKFIEFELWNGFPSKNDWFGGWAKRIGELQAEAYKIQNEWNNIKIVRPANVYGAYDNFDPKGSMVIPSLIRKAYESENYIEVLGDGSAIRDFIHASDVARACLFSIVNDIQTPINVGSGVGYSIKQLAQTIIELSGKDLDIKWSEKNNSGDSIRIMDMKLSNSYGFYPEMSLIDGITTTYEWFVNNIEKVNDRFDAFK